MSDNPTSALFSQDYTGPRVSKLNESRAESEEWNFAYSELFRPVYHWSGSEVTSLVFHHSAPCSVRLETAALPMARPVAPSGFLPSLQTIERCLSSSASDIAKMLRVSRQMIYHYRKGMEPAIDNFRRMQLIANLVDHVAGDVSLEPIIKVQQPEGKSLLAFLSAPEPNTSLVRRIVMRANDDLKSRLKLAELIASSTPYDRSDVMRERLAKDKPIYVTHPLDSGRLVQIRPDGSRVAGRINNRVFVPDGE